jgi:tetratricopeptide (TPR) repeat protein
VGGKCNGGITLELCRPGAKKCEERFTIYKAIGEEGEEGEETCTTHEQATRELARAKKAFAAAGVDLKVKPVPLLKAKGKDAGFLIPPKVMKPLGVSAPVAVRHAHRPDPEEAGVVMTFEAEAKGFGRATFARESCYSYCICATKQMQMAPDGSVVFNLMNQHCGVGVGDAVKTRVIASRLLNGRGFRLHKKKDFRASARDFGKAFALDPAYAQAAFNLACAHAKLGEKGAAMKALGKAIAIEPARFRRKAKKDEDLASLRGEAGFKKLVGG